MLTGIQIQSRSHAQSYNTATGYAQLHANQFKKIYQITDSLKIINYEGIDDGSQITKLIVQYHQKSNRNCYQIDLANPVVGVHLF